MQKAYLQGDGEGSCLSYHQGLQGLYAGEVLLRPILPSTITKCDQIINSSVSNILPILINCFVTFIY